MGLLYPQVKLSKWLLHKENDLNLRCIRIHCGGLERLLLVHFETHANSYIWWTILGSRTWCVRAWYNDCRGSMSMASLCLLEQGVKEDARYFLPTVKCRKLLVQIFFLKLFSKFFFEWIFIKSFVELEWATNANVSRNDDASIGKKTD